MPCTYTGIYIIYILQHGSAKGSHSTQIGRTLYNNGFSPINVITFLAHHNNVHLLHSCTQYNIIKKNRFVCKMVNIFLPFSRAVYERNFHTYHPYFACLLACLFVRSYLVRVLTVRMEL